ncbi:putative bifunctional diguanylate cyclase/phosphodiesterase [Luteimonas aquatica]|uniref:putative bifunctional diguanylate cyclase/phosphodiesterase n=1 Tax=Luteimonas aquatica TaxID=450364 RepID=UPI001F597295|nr:GGDEF domain-containing phosphodiesterase [Luteimonas aquatica]
MFAVDLRFLAVAALALVALVAWRNRAGRSRLAAMRELEERLKLALWASGEYYWDYDVASGLVRRLQVADPGNGDAGRLVTSTLDIGEVGCAEDRPLIHERIRRYFEGGEDTYRSEHRVPGADGKLAWVRSRGRAVARDAAGKVLRMAGTTLDITRERAAEGAHRVAAQVLRSMSEAVTVMNRDFEFVSVNPAFTRITGYEDNEVIGRSAALLDSPRHDSAFYRHVRDLITRHGHYAGELWQRRKDGEEFLCAYEFNVVHDGGGQPQYFVAVLSDITQQKRAEEELRYLANHDTLTGLPNRTLLSERLWRAILHAQHSQTRIAVLFLDLDRFKDINDSLGHATGDRILCAAARRLQSAVGEHHTVARHGGDEFTVVLENLAAHHDADAMAQAVLDAFEAPLSIDKHLEVSISPSIGVSLYPDHGASPASLLKHADTAMYQAKAGGRRMYMRYDETMEVASRRRAVLSGALRKVLERNELHLVYQPRLTLARTPPAGTPVPARITGAEALLRWNSREHGEIDPTEFIPLAEESGLIREIGEWVLREACTTLRHWRRQGVGDFRMSVNVSGLQLMRGDFPRVVREILAETDVPADALELELTESVLMASAEQAAARVQAFRELGVALAIDDFGTGYSSLAYLKRLPITTVKIDKEFIGDLARNPDDAAITGTIVAMAHSLGLTVVAEGVETDAQMRFLQQRGCHEIQGFWLSPPLGAGDCLDFVRRWTPACPGGGGALS